MAPAWTARYIGGRYEIGGRGPDVWDCYGLMATIMRAEYALDVPLFLGALPPDHGRPAMAAAIAARKSPDWQRVNGDPKPGDGALFRVGADACHCGAVIAPNLMIHIHDGLNVTVDCISGDRWGNRLVGIFRWAGPQLS